VHTRLILGASSLVAAVNRILLLVTVAVAPAVSAVGNAFQALRAVAGGFALVLLLNAVARDNFTFFSAGADCLILANMVIRTVIVRVALSP
jgi:hypothetical protein